MKGTLSDLVQAAVSRMLGPKGNPQARNLLEVIAHLQKTSGLRMELSLKRI